MTTLFGGIGSLLGLNKNNDVKEPSTTPDFQDNFVTMTPQVEDFPWEKYLIEEDIISMWKVVDMK
jgi:hypothetical protein